MTNELIERATRALRDFVAPSLDLDGELLEAVAVEDGIASVRMNGACASCPASITTMLFGMERELRKYVPEIEMIEAVV